MGTLRRKFTVKVFLSYLAIIVLAILGGKTALGVIEDFTNAATEKTHDTSKIIQISKILTLLYEGESLGRVAIQTNEEEVLEEYLGKNRTLHTEINVLKDQTQSTVQKQLLDSVSALINKKIQNISDLRDIRNNNTTDESIQNAIKIIANLENYMGRLTLEDLVGNPDRLSAAERKKWQDYVNLLNSNISNEQITDADKRKMDSIILSSKDLLKKIHHTTASQNKILQEKEKDLMQNDLEVTRQLKTMLTQLEHDVLKASQQLNNSRIEALNKSRTVLTISAIVGLFFIIIFSVIIINDFWKSQRLREDLEAANRYANSLLKSREHLISMVSHDLKTPLNTIIGYSELLSKNTIEPKAANYVTHIKNASGFVAQMVDELLDYTKLEAGKIQIEKVPFKIVPLVEETAYSVQSLHTKKPIDLIINISDDCNQTFVGDSYRIKQVLYNLLGNAYKFTKEGSITTTILLVANQSKLAIAVTDTGIGIAKAKQELIFQEFQQAEDDIEAKFGGSGLGLHISRKLANLMGGTLQVSSTPGTGSTFTLTLPAKFTKEAPKQEPQQDTLPQFTNLTAVVIDDDITLLELNKELLSAAGIKVISFTRGKQALEKLETLTYDVIITDIQLPEMNGFHFLDTLQQRNIKKPVIAVTGRKDLPEENYIEGGFSAIVFKPYTSDMLLAALGKLFPDAATETTQNEPTELQKEIVTEQLNYNLKSLAGFLGNDEVAIKKILRSYIENTQANVTLLNQYHKENKLQELGDLCHQMLTMLKQLAITKESELLIQLEKNNELSNEQIDELVRLFNEAIVITLQQLTDYCEASNS